MNTSGRFSWPDPINPTFITRDLTLLQKERDQPPIPLSRVMLIELIPHSLYIVPPDVYSKFSNVSGLQAGRVLSRNLKVSQRIHGSVQKDIHQCFISFDGVYTAQRSFGRIDRRYKAEEIPANNQLAGVLDYLLRQSWELHRLEDDDREEFVLYAIGAADEYGSPIDAHKVEAQQRTRQVSQLEDSRGRFNPGRLPLVCLAGERQIYLRTQSVRCIGRRMGFREAVLEYYISRIRDLCRTSLRSLHQKLKGEWLGHAPHRTARIVKQEAERLQRMAQKFRSIVVRPFCRALIHCADELDEATKLLYRAARQRRAELIEEARTAIEKVYRSLKLVECHWRLEDVLLLVSDLHDRKRAIGASEQCAWYKELESIYRTLVQADPVTGKKLEHQFQRRVLPHVVPHVYLSIKALMEMECGKDSDFTKVRQELKLACEPL